MRYSVNLPIEEVLPDIRRALEHGRSAVVEAPPGAGKTTIVPLALLDEPWLAGGRIIMLEPRRLAARAAAMRMADLLGEEVGSTVGYRTRLDSKTGPYTRIEVVTEGILTRFLQNDPSLQGAGCVIFDEFHERSVHADLGLALTLESRSVLREDLRVLVMSATLDGQEVSGILGGAPVIKSMGRTFPVAVRYTPEDGRPVRFEWLTGPAFISRVAGAVFTALTQESGSILVFLPGSGEIKRVEALLREKNLHPDVQVVPLYGDLQRETQDLAIRPAPAGKRKVVLATSIAETSLTIEGVTVVIDSGLKRVQRFSPSTGMSRLETVMVTKDSAEQRRGRAGRTGPGVSIRLWAEVETRALREKNTPEILEADLTPLALELAIRGVKDPAELQWLDHPPAGGMMHARDVLTRLEAMDTEGNATEHGIKMAKLPLHPRLAHMVIKGKELGLGSMACHLSAFLTERDFFRMKPDGRDSDLRHRLEVLLGRSGHAVSHDIDRALCERIRAVARQVKRALGVGDSAEDIEKTGLLLAFAYPDRIARRRSGKENRYLLANGRGAYFQRTEPLAAEEYLVAASLDGGDRESSIYLAAPVTVAALEEHFSDDIKESEVVEWDQGVKGVAARRRRTLWGLVLSDARIENPGKEDLLEAFLAGIRQNGLRVLPWERRSENLMARIKILSRLGKDNSSVSSGFTHEFSDEWLIDNLKEWLGPCLVDMTRLEHLKRLDMHAVITGMLTWEERQALERLVPTHITVPSGSRVPIDYTGGERPVLAVRLQEMFGLDKTPTIANGKLALLLHLLSPAGRPVQVTEDLAGFWAASYQIVKKELKGRYPKHYWPDDPLRSEPARGVKRAPRADK
ncbi:MAG: ATP-dependent helicase HrpB [Deltaproteobacteria bacterium]|nr:ATP-dependent helicase HrpB [Deltaproteobacteria bacterium]